MAKSVILCVGVALAGFGSMTQAAGVVYTDLSSAPLTITYGGSGGNYVDFQLGDGDSAGEAFSTSGGTFVSNDSYSIFWDGFNTFGVTASTSSSLLTAGSDTTINFVNFGDSVATAIGASSNFEGDFSVLTSSGIKYVGLQDSNGNYGWAELSVVRLDSISLLAFAVDTNPGEDIAVGAVSAVPEPRTWGFIAGVVVLAAAMFVRRRSFTACS